MTAGQTSMSLAGIDFPVTIVCPSCKKVLAPPGCGCDGGVKLKIEDGLPRTLFGQKFWGETSSANMTRILELMRSMHWREALQVVAKDEPVTRHLTSTIGPDIVHAFPWSKIKTVIDIGAGMGFASAEMAKYGKTIVSLEAVPERARFLKMRAAQDKLNIFPIIANAMEIPFRDGTFDLVTLNGVFEYLGLWGEGDPEEIQLNFLKRILRLLSPTGYLYIGIETRLAWSAFLGVGDHSGLAYTSLMPRKMADLYCKLRSRPVYGSEHVTRGYRTYTYTPAKYKRLMTEAGFKSVQVQGVFDGYNNQLALYSLEEPGMRAAILDCVDPARSAMGRLRRKILNFGMLYRTLEPEVAIFASKERNCQPLLWHGLTPVGKVGQINRHTKLIAAIYENGALSQIAESAKNDTANAGMAKAFALLSRAQQQFGQESRNWPLRWAEPLGTQIHEGRRFYRYEFIKGGSLIYAVHNSRSDTTSTLGMIENVMKSYPDLCRRLSKAAIGLGLESGAEWEADLAALRPEDPLRTALQDAHARAIRKGWELLPIHGDLSGNNLLLAPNGGLVLIDWDRVSVSHLPQIDLIRLYYDFLCDLIPKYEREFSGLLEAFRKLLRKTLIEQGFEEADFAPLETLFIAHQRRPQHSAGENTGNAHLLNIYGSGKYSIAGGK